ncbi:hypothetical protein N752_17730 [Desulforamulus aquiferis]|nr:hypothetical protein N752_17730 [Desulforamulus aquiferis]
MNSEEKPPQVKPAPGPGIPPGAGGQVPWVALLILVIGAFMAILDTSIVNVALPRFMTLFARSQIRYSGF